MVKCVGCQSLVASTESYKHYIACPHGPCGCTEAINTGCSFTGPPRELLVHLQASHSIPVFTFQSAACLFPMYKAQLLLIGLPAPATAGTSDLSTDTLMAPFGLPCVLCCDPADKPWVFKEDLPVHNKCKLVPLDRFSYDGLVPHGKDEERAGANGDWIAMVGPEGKWNLLNVYTHRKIKLPSLRKKFETTRNPLIFGYKGYVIQLQKIAICQVPTAARRYEDFSLVAIFDFAIAYLHAEYPGTWIILENQFLFGAIYCDAIIHNGLVFAVTGLGNVYAWDPNQFDDKKHRVEENSIFSDDKVSELEICGVEPLAKGVVSRESSEVDIGGLPSVETSGLPGAGIVEISANGAVPPDSYKLEHVPDAPDQLLQAIVTTKDQPACFVISCILFDKLKHCNWRIVQSHQHGEGYVYVKMIHADLVRFHDKMYGWGEARATFCSIHTIFALEPDPMDAYPVVQLS
ncbi:hypothetical protein QYE76_001863 [Lolium multiflorum]|uniref:SIAH-type domain-containing protein n=1 Tax=Lolium multiflorum TaxID=4521 RepID=A0AAD8RM57_LOLMU|nr:hypothetical protein QYE76_001863 [Lolium multiflorum]